jgi:hypothetical protein
MSLEENLHEVSHRSSFQSITLLALDESSKEIKKEIKTDLEVKVHVQEKEDNFAEEVHLDMLEYGLDAFSGTYSRVPLDYDSLWYGSMRKQGSLFEDEDDSQALFWNDTESETMTMEEAEATLKDIQYAQVAGTLSDVDYNERRRFATWALFNSTERELMHSTYAVTSNVNYSRIF